MNTPCPFKTPEPIRTRGGAASNRRCLLLLIVGVGLVLAGLVDLQMTQAAPATLFVKPTGTGTSCTRDLPCKLHTALDLAGDGDSIYVGHGTYTGKGTDVITLTKSIALYGGWNGLSFGPIARDPEVYESILDGESTRRVVRISGNVTPTLDGFTIANGNATGLLDDCGEDMPDGCGGGIFVYQAHPIISGNIITNNIAAITSVGYPIGTTGYGGGIYLRDAARTIVGDNRIVGNVASIANCGAGGGIFLNSTGDISGALVEANRIYSNTATTTNLGCGWGGGINGGPYGVVVQGNSIYGNRANGYGGGQGAGLYQWYGSATYRKNYVGENQGSASGHAVYLGHSMSRFDGNWVVDNNTLYGIKLVNGTGTGPSLVNNVLDHNSGQAFVAVGSPSAPLTATLLHNTLVGSGSGTAVQVDAGSVALYMTNTIVTGYSIGITNTVPANSTLSADHTLFWANADDGIRGSHPVDGNPAFAADRYHLTPGSAALNVGIDAGLMYDVDGDARPNGTGWDIGADEAQFWWLDLPLLRR